MDVFILGRFINAVCFGLIIFLSGKLFQRSFNGSIAWFLIGSWLSFSSISILALATNIATDPLFIVLVLCFALLGGAYLAKPRILPFFGLVLIAILASILRWNGLVVIISTAFLVLYAHRENPKTALWNALWVSGMALFPIAFWVIGRNYRLYETLMGTRNIAAINIPTNIIEAIGKISHWIIPLSVYNFLHPIFIFLGFILILGLINRKSTWKKFIKRLLQPIHIPWVVFSPIYLLLVVSTSVGYSHPSFHDDRYFAPIYVFFLLFLSLAISELVLNSTILSTKLPSHAKAREYLLIGIFLIWSLYPTYRTYRYTMVSRSEGDFVYNVYNTRKIRESDIIAYLQDKIMKEDKPIYSNIPAMVYFFTRQISHPSLRASSYEEKSIKDLSTQYEGWLDDEGAYLIWFLPNPWHLYYEPNELRNIAQLTKLVIRGEGKIFLIQNQTKSR
jgi:hypothetical protein